MRGLTKTVVTEGRWKGGAYRLDLRGLPQHSLNYKGKKIRIDGGVGNTFDLMGYVYALDNSIAGNID